MWILKLVLVGVLLFIFWQDYKDRIVYWFLYPVVGVLAFFIQMMVNGAYVSLMNTGVNFCLTALLLAISFIYAKTAMKIQFQNEAMGTGDILLLICLCATFANTTYIILLVFSLLFSLVLHFFLKAKSAHPTVPLAGYMAVFYAAVYAVSLFIEPRYLFAY